MDSTCVVDATDYEHSREARLSARRFNKHVAERKRRARINVSLEQLKSMILSSLDKNPEEFEKMEKADILDLTVKFMKAAQKQQQQLKQQQQPQQPRIAHVPAVRTMQPLTVQTTSYQAGYNSAANQVQRYVQASDLDHATAARLAAHLRAQGTSVGRLISHPKIKRCEPSLSLCRDLSREMTSPSHTDITSLSQSFQSLKSCTSSVVASRPHANHRAGHAYRTGGGMWRPWEGQVAA